MPREPQKSSLLFVSALLSVFGGLIVVFGQNPPVDAGRALPLRESELIAQGRPLPDYDVRRDSGAVPADLQRVSAADLQQRLGPDTLVQFDAQSGGVSQIFQAGGYLTDAQAGAPSAILNGFLVEHADVFGLSQAGISSFTMAAEDRDGATGVTHIYLEQHVAGLRVFGSVVKGHVDETGRVISVEANYYPVSAAVTSGARLSAEDAVLAALRSSLPDMLTKALAQQAPAEAPPGSTLVTVGSPYRFPRLLQAERGPDRWTTFEPGPFAKPIEVRQVIFPTADGLMLAWQVEVARAQSPSLLRAAGGCHHRNAPVSDEYVPLCHGPLGLGLSKEPRCVAGGSSWISSVVLIASPLGWSDGSATVGNNVQADSATSAGDFIFPFTDAWKILGVNPFDLEGLRLRFTPTDGLASGYTVAATSPQSDRPNHRGRTCCPSFANTDDGTINLTCSGWAATMLGGTFTSLWVNTNGSVSFGSGSTDDFSVEGEFEQWPAPDRRVVARPQPRYRRHAYGRLRSGRHGAGCPHRLECRAELVGGANTHTFAIVVHGAAPAWTTSSTSTTERSPRQAASSWASVETQERRSTLRRLGLSITVI